jgi:hypothetical protein
MQLVCIWWSTAPCPSGRRMTRAALAYGAARVGATDTGGVGWCRGRLRRRASSPHTWGGLPSIGQRRHTMALQHSMRGGGSECDAATQAPVDDAVTTGNSRTAAGNGAAEVDWMR